MGSIPGKTAIMSAVYFIAGFVILPGGSTNSGESGRISSDMNGWLNKSDKEVTK